MTRKQLRKDVDRYMRNVPKYPRKKKKHLKTSLIIFYDTVNQIGDLDLFEKIYLPFLSGESLINNRII